MQQANWTNLNYHLRVGNDLKQLLKKGKKHTYAKNNINVLYQ